MATYDDLNGGVTVNFDMCGAQPQESDFVAIYPCDAPTMTADKAWNETVADYMGNYMGGVGAFDIGYVENQVYVNQNPVWYGYTCGSPGDKCQQDPNIEWPTSGTVIFDPAVAKAVAGTHWAFPGGKSLNPGCYKVLLNRDTEISPPPYPTICAEWAEASEFTVP